MKRRQSLGTLFSATLTLLVGCAGGYALLTAWLGEWFRVYTWSIPRGWSQFAPVRIEGKMKI